MKSNQSCRQIQMFSRFGLIQISLCVADTLPSVLVVFPSNCCHFHQQIALSNYGLSDSRGKSRFHEHNITLYVCVSKWIMNDCDARDSVHECGVSVVCVCVCVCVCASIWSLY